MFYVSNHLSARRIAFAALFAPIVCLTANVYAQESPGNAASTDTAKVERIPVLFATVRKPGGNESADAYFTGQRGHGSTGICNMEYTAIWGMDRIADSLPFHVPQERIQLATVETIPLQRFWDEINAWKHRDGGNIVLYVHGYNIGFKKSCLRASIFQRNLDLHDRLVLFSWPADGNVMNYTQDEADLAWSVHSIEQLLKEFVRRYGAEHIDVVGHSLGARGVVKALDRMSRHGSRLLINELVLIAPDMDAQIFGQLLPTIRPLSRRISLYASANDHALRLSHEVHGYPRLGEGGDLLNVYPGVETIDVSSLGQRVASGHIYHLFNPVVSQDIMRLLNTGESAGQRPGLVADQKGGLLFWHLNPSM